MRSRLTARELEVALLVRSALSYKAIGRQLGISHKTVELHVYRAAAKLPGDRRLPPKARILILPEAQIQACG